DLVVLGVDEGLELHRDARVLLLERREDDVLVGVGVLGAPGPHPQGDVLGALLAVRRVLGLLVAGGVVPRVRGVGRRCAGGEEEDGGQRCRGVHAALHHGSLRDGGVWLGGVRDRTASRTSPPASSSAARAVPASVAEGLMTCATFMAPSAAPSKRPPAARTAPVA